MYEIKDDELSEEESRYIYEFKDVINEVVPRDSEAKRMWCAASQILFYLEVFESASEKIDTEPEEKIGRYAPTMADLSH